MAIFIPEIELHNTLKAILTLIREDYENRSNKEHTLLYKILGSNRLQRYNLYEQGKKVFLAKEDDPRFLDVQMFFNMKRASIPTIHITLPSEQAGQDGLGIDEGYADPAYDEIPSLGDPDVLQTSPNYTRRFDTTYNIIITSDNTNEVILIYHLLRAILIPVFDHLNQVGIENCKIGGRDIQAYPSLVPDSIFMRGLSLSFSYQITSPGIFKQDIIQKIILDYSIEIELPVDEDEDSSDITPTRPNYLTCSTLPYCDVIQQIEADIEELQNSQGVSIHNNLQGLNDGEYQHLTVAEKNTLHTHSNKSILDLITEAFTTVLKTAYDSTVTWITANGSALISHLTDTNNPHSVTKTQVGLGNVDNTSDLNKPISTTTQMALDNKEDKSNLFDEGFSFIDVETAYYKRNTNFRINSVENPDLLTITIEVNGTPYTLTDPINAYDEVTIDVDAVGFIVLNCEVI